MTSDRSENTEYRDIVVDHYASGYEKDRLKAGPGKMERARTRELLERFLPEAPAFVLDVGGGAGEYACWLARRKYEVHLIDIVPLHVEMARRTSEGQPDTPLASAEVGDAVKLSMNDASFDAVLLFGPLYHLTRKHDRERALKEAHRVLRKDGILMAVGISRFASALEGLRCGCLRDPQFVDIVNRDLRDGQHRNRTGNPYYFIDTFFHHPEELRTEVTEVGFEVESVYGLEGPTWLAPEFDEMWKDDTHRQTLLALARRLETEPAMIGASSHLLAVGKKL